MSTTDHVTGVACRSSFLTQTIGCEKPESKLKSEVVTSILTDRKKKKVKRSKMVAMEEVSVAEGQKLREQVVVQEILGVKPGLECQRWKWHC